MAFVAYLDGSGDGTDPSTNVVSVGGYIAHESQWLEFERRWALTLSESGVDALHMKEFAHSVGSFKEWRGDEARRARFMAELVRIINECTIQTVMTSILMSGYRQVNDTHALSEALGGPYPMALWWTVARTVDWHQRHGHTEPLIIVIERGDNDQGEFTRVLKAFGEWNIELVTPPIFQKKQWVDAAGVTQRCLPLQAADFFCYETTKMITDWVVKGKTKVRESMFGLSYPPKGDERDRLMMQFNTAAGLKKIVKAFNVVKRFNRPLELGGNAPLEPLCYVDMDHPIICEVSPQPSAKGRRRAMRAGRGSDPDTSVLRHKVPAKGKTSGPSELS